MQIGCYPLQTALVKALILFLYFLGHKGGSFTQCHECMWGSREFGQTGKASVTAKGHWDNQGRQWGSRETSFPDQPKPRKMGSMGRLHTKKSTMAWSLSHTYAKEVSVT